MDWSSALHFSYEGGMWYGSDQAEELTTRISGKHVNETYLTFDNLGSMLQYWLADAQQHRFTDI
eukprot:1293219-Pyramimonas_sp.AAC.1